MALCSIHIPNIDNCIIVKHLNLFKEFLGSICKASPKKTHYLGTSKLQV